MTAGNTRNTMTGAEAMVRMLEAHGVRHIFGLCGDTSLPFYDALYQLDHNIDHILVTPTLQVDRVGALNFSLSDHLPVEMEITLPDTVRLDRAA